MNSVLRRIAVQAWSLLLLGMIGCLSVSPTATPDVPATMEAEIAVQLAGIATPEPAPTFTPLPAPTPAFIATPRPTATATPLPTPTPVATATPEPTATATPLPTATPTPEPEPTPVPTATPTPSPIPGSTLGVPVSAYIAYPDVKSYKHLVRVSFRLEAEDQDAVIAMTVEGEVEGGDRLTCRETLDLGGLTLSRDKVVIIGDRAWLDLGEGWAAVTPDDSGVVEVLDFCAGSNVFWEDFDLSDLKVPEGETEEINGVPATRIDLAQASESMASFGFTPSDWGDANLEQLIVWLAQGGGWPVRIWVRISGTAESLELTEAGFEKEQNVVAEFHIELSEINDPSIRVSSPLP